MKNIYKKWWFWLVIVFIIIAIILIHHYIQNKKIENKFKSIGESATNYYKETQNSEGYLDRFTYNYSTGKVDYTE